MVRSIKEKFNLILLFAFSNYLIGCGNMKAEIKDLSGSSSKLPIQNKICDYGKTTIHVSSSAEADGSTNLVAIVNLKNNDNSHCSGFTPSFSISPNAGVVSSGCTVSDANGVSSCSIKSSIPGTKTFTLTNGKVGLSEAVEFVTPQGFEKSTLVSGGGIGTTANGSRMQVSIGNPIQGVKHTTSGGYKVILSLQGIVTQ